MMRARATSSKRLSVGWAMAFSITVESTVMAWNASTGTNCIRTATATVALSKYSPPSSPMARRKRLI